MKRVLVIAPQWIGDAVMSQPLMAALAADGNTVAVAALPWVAPVYRAMPEVAEVMALPFAHGRLDLGARWSLGRAWRGRYDVAVVLPNSLKAALLPLFAGIRERIGYVGEARRWLLTRSLSSPSGRPPMVRFYRALADLARSTPDRAVPGPLRPSLAVSEAVVEALLARFALQRGDYWVFAPGAEYGPAKCWPAEHYASLATLLHASAPERPVLLLGSPKEGGLTAGIAGPLREAGVNCLDLAGQTSLDEAVALLSACRGLVSNDSGLMHIGAAFGVPQVAVFGSTSPEHTPPLNERAAVIWLKDELQLDCSPCFARTCAYGHLRCLTSVTPERVAQRLEAAVSGTLSPVS